MKQRSQRRSCLALAFALLLLALPSSSAFAVGMRVRGSHTRLRLVRHDVSVKVEHPLAVVRITQEFENPLTRAVEADYTYRLPKGATVDDLGLWVNGVRRPARMLERQRAKEIYEGIVAQKRDPALVEKTASGLYRVRIFPVLPKQRTRIELRYTQLSEQLGAGLHRLRLHHEGRAPLRISGAIRAAGGPRGVRVEGYSATLRRSGDDWSIPRRASAQDTKGPVDLKYRVDPALPQALVQRRGEKRYLLAALPAPASTQEWPRTAILLDSSKSMAPHWKRARQLAQAIASELPSGGKTMLFALRLRPTTTSVAEIDDLEPEGGSALLPAFERARRLDAQHLVLITDSPPSSHQAEIEHLARRVYDLNQGDADTAIRLSVVQLDKEGSSRASLEHLAQATGGIFRVASEAGKGDKEVAAAIGEVRTTLSRLEGGPEAHVIHRGAAMQVVTVELPAGKTATLRIGGVEHALDPREVVHGPATLWGAAQIAKLQQKIRLFGEDQSWRRSIVALSKDLRVASEYTALLVTEKDADYDRPTSGRIWQRRVHRMGEGVPAPMNYHATPEPHEWAMIALALAMIFASRRQGFGGLFRRGRTGR